MLRGALDTGRGQVRGSSPGRGGMETVPAAAASSVTRNNPTAEPCGSCPRHGTARYGSPLPPAVRFRRTRVTGKGISPRPAAHLPGAGARPAGAGGHACDRPRSGSPGAAGVGGAAGGGGARAGRGRSHSEAPPLGAARHAGSGSSGRVGARRARWRPRGRGEGQTDGRAGGTGGMGRGR